MKIKSIRKLIALMAIVFFAQNSFGIERDDQAPKIRNKLSFIKNSGQIRNNSNKSAADVLYYSEVQKTGVFFQKNKVSYIQYNNTEKKLPKAHKIDVVFLNSNQNVMVTASGEEDTKYNFYSESNQSGITDVRGFQKLTYHNLYPSIDLVYSIDKNSIKYDIVIHPGGDISDIQFEIDGAKNLELANNVMNIHTSIGNITDEIPVSYYNDDKQTPLDFIKLNKNNNVISFDDVSYNHTKTLVIDPSLKFFNNIGPNSIYGNNADDGLTSGKAIKHETNGNVTIVGQTNTLVFYQSPGSANYVSYNGESPERAFIAQYDANGGLNWCSTMEYASCAVTFSDVCSSYPLNVVCGTTAGLYGNPGIIPGTTFNSPNGASDAFVSIFNSTGQLINSLYIGGPNDDGATCISEPIPQTGYIIGGYSENSILNSTPLTGPYPFNGGRDGFLCTVLPFDQFHTIVFDPIKYTFLGSPEIDEVSDIDFMRNSNKLAVTGTTFSRASNFSPYITTIIGSNVIDSDKDIFVAHYDIPAFHYSTNFYCNYAATIGTDNDDEDLPRIDVQDFLDANDFHVAFLTKSSSLNSITSTNAYQKNMIGINYNNFYISLSQDFNVVNYATYFHEAVITPVLTPVCVKKDWLSNTFLVATTNSSSIAYTHDNTVSGTPLPNSGSTNKSDIMIARFNPDYSLEFLTRTGNVYSDVIADIDVTRENELNADCKTNIYLTGTTTTDIGNTFGINSIITDDNPFTLTSSNGNQLPSTITIFGLQNLSAGNLAVQWYFNGMPYDPDPITQVAYAQNITANLPGEYYATITYNGCTYVTKTIIFKIDCYHALYKTPDLKVEIEKALGAGKGEYKLPPGQYHIKDGDVVLIPKGTKVYIENSLIVAFSCSRIEVEGDGELNINGSVLTSCTTWDGILYKGRYTKGNISNCGISNATVGIFRYYEGYNGAIPVMISSNNFHNNNLHITLFGGDIHDPNLPLLGHNYIYNNRMFNLKDEFCEPRIDPYVEVIKEMKAYDSYVYTNVPEFEMIHNYQYGVDADRNGRVYGFRSVHVFDDFYFNNFYRGRFKTCIDILYGAGTYVFYEDMNSDNSDYGVKIINDISGSDISPMNNKIYNSNPNNIAGISIKNAVYSEIAFNEITGYTNGIEYFSDEELLFDPNDHHTYDKVNKIHANSIYPIRSGVVVSYKVDPYISTNGENNYPYNYQIGAWITCNYIEGGNFGILGSGHLLDQVFKPNLLPTPPDYTDPGNEFRNILNYDVIWDNSYQGAAGFTYYANISHVPNNPTNPLPIPVILNGYTKSSTSNDFWINNIQPNQVPIVRQYCAPIPNKGRAGNSKVDEKTLNNLSNDFANIYPNPSSDLFKVELKNDQINKIEVIDVLGKLVYSKIVSDAFETIDIPCNDWQTGVYFVKLYHDNTMLNTQKFMKGN